MRLLIFIILNLCATYSFAQFTWEVGGMGGSSHYLGDIGGTKNEVANFGPSDLIFSVTRFTVGGFTRRELGRRFYVNFQLNYIFLTADDANSEDTWRRPRNLNFSSHIIEASARAEYHLIKAQDMSIRRNTLKKGFNLYVFAGIGLIYNNPRTKYNGSWVALQPLMTEGEDKKYSRIQPVIPVGFGLSYSFKSRSYKQFQTRALRKHRVGIELNYRFTATDYIDDVSSSYPDQAVMTDPTARDLYWRKWELVPGQEDPATRRYPKEGAKRGDPNHNDGYFTFTVYYSYRIFSGYKRFSSQKHRTTVGGRSSRRRSSKFK